MNYTIKLTPTAEEDLKKFDKEMQKIFFGKIEKLSEYPYIHGKPLRYQLVGKWEIRLQKRWRIIYIIDEKNRQVEIVAIWHKDDF